MRRIDWFLYFPLGVATVVGYAAQRLYLVAALVALSQLLIWHLHLSRNRAAGDKADLRRGRPDRPLARVSDWPRNAATWMRGGALSRYAAILLVLMGVLTGIILKRSLSADILRFGPS